MVTPVGETGGQGWLIFSGAESLKQKKILQQEEKKNKYPRHLVWLTAPWRAAQIFFANADEVRVTFKVSNDLA